MIRSTKSTRPQQKRRRETDTNIENTRKVRDRDVVKLNRPRNIHVCFVYKRQLKEERIKREKTHIAGYSNVHPTRNANICLRKSFYLELEHSKFKRNRMSNNKKSLSLLKSAYGWGLRRVAVEFYDIEIPLIVKIECIYGFVCVSTISYTSWNGWSWFWH